MNAVKIAYFDSRARPYDHRLNYTDLVTYMEAFCCVDEGDVLLALAPRDDAYVVERRLAVSRVEIGGDCLDVYCDRVHHVGATAIARGDSRLGAWWPELRAYAVEVPDSVAIAMGWRA